MKKTRTLFAVAALVATGCVGADPTGPAAEDTLTPGDLAVTAAATNACWGQASAVFAQMGEMGQHSSQQPTPRSGLRNLARLLADDGIIPDDSMTSLGVFVADALGLSIDACM